MFASIKNLRSIRPYFFGVGRPVRGLVGERGGDHRGQSVLYGGRFIQVAADEAVDVHNKPIPRAIKKAKIKMPGIRLLNCIIFNSPFFFPQPKYRNKQKQLTL